MSKPILNTPLANSLDTNFAETERGSVQHHRNVWPKDFVFSLSSPYSDPQHLKHAESLVAEIKHMLSLLFASSETIGEQLMLVDALHCLGIDKRFPEHIQVTLDRVYSFWDDDAGFQTSEHPHLLLLSLAFSLLRQQRYKITTRCFEGFKRGNSCFVLEAHNNQSDERERASYERNETEKVKSFLSLLRASSIAFPGETVLQGAEQFSTRFLSDWLTEKGHHPSDIEDSLTKEVEHVLQFPRQSNPPLWESRSYIDIFDCNHDWLRFTRNQKILELAKLQFNIKQAVYQQEMKQVMSWWSQEEIPKYHFMRERPMESYFLSAMSAPDIELSEVRDIFTKSTVIGYALDDISDNYATVDEFQRLCEGLERWDVTYMDVDENEKLKGVFKFVISSLQELFQEICGDKNNGFYLHLRDIWLQYVKAYVQESIWNETKTIPTLDEYIKINIKSSAMSAIFSVSLPYVDPNFKYRKYFREYSKVFYLSEVVIRLTDDLKDFQDVKKKGEILNVIVCHQKQYPKASMEETVCHLNNLLREVWMDFNKWHFEQDGLPLQGKEYCYNATRMSSFLLRVVDGYTYTSTIIKEQMTKIFITNA